MPSVGTVIYDSTTICHVAAACTSCIIICRRRIPPGKSLRTNSWTYDLLIQRKTIRIDGLLLLLTIVHGRHCHWRRWNRIVSLLLWFLFLVTSMADFFFFFFFLFRSSWLLLLLLLSEKQSLVLVLQGRRRLGCNGLLKSSVSNSSNRSTRGSSSSSHIGTNQSSSFWLGFLLLSFFFYGSLIRRIVTAEDLQETNGGYSIFFRVVLSFSWPSRNGSFGSDYHVVVVKRVARRRLLLWAAALTAADMFWNIGARSSHGSSC